MCESLELPLYFSDDGNLQPFISKIDETFLVLAFQDVIANNSSNLYIVSGPQILPHDLSHKENSARIVFNTLTPWVEKLYNCFAKNWNEYQFICAPIPLNYEKIQSQKHQQHSNHVLLYLKGRSSDIMSQCQEITKAYCESNDLQLTIFEYGKYEYKDYLNTLENSKFIIFCIGSESQGFCVHEAMAMNTPILMFDSLYMTDSPDNVTKYSPQYQQCDLSSEGATLWDDHLCGVRIRDIQYLFNSLEHMNKNYNPRQVLLNEMNPEKCLQRLLYPFVTEEL